jgi:hypothetical protein
VPSALSFDTGVKGGEFKAEVDLACRGHFTIGWRISSKRSVSLVEVENGDARQKAIFAISSTRGQLATVVVK